MEKLIYVATGNKSKLGNFTKFFNWIDPEITVELVPDYVEVVESGETLAENSRLKVLPYLGKYSHPVITNDAGLFFDETVTEIQDPVKVKRNALNGDDEKDLTQEEIGSKIFSYYRQVARNHGGKIDCEMRDVFTILFPDGEISQVETTREYKLVDRETDKYDIYHPLNSLRISKRVGKFMDEMSEEEEALDKKALVDALRSLITRN